jgi:hypothetical protein
VGVILLTSSALSKCCAACWAKPAPSNAAAKIPRKPNLKLFMETPDEKIQIIPEKSKLFATWTQTAYCAIAGRRIPAGGRVLRQN